MEQIKPSWIKSHPILTAALGILGFIFLISLLDQVTRDNGVTPNSINNSQPSACSDSSSIKNQAQSIDFKELNKNPDVFNGRITKFTGKILQIQESAGSGIIRLAVTQESYGWSSSDVVYVEYQNHTDALQDDVVTVYGQLTGSKTYTSQAKWQLTIPSMTACAIEKGAGMDAQQKPEVSNKLTPVPKPAKAYVPIQSPASTPAPIPETPKTWHRVIDTTIQIDTNTPPFAMQGSQWRITYHCVSGKEFNTFYGRIDSTEKGYGSSFANGVTCPQSNTSYEYAQSPGQYYLDIRLIDAAAEIVIEDYY